MPEYTSRVIILNDKREDEELWYNNIKASSLKKATAMVKQQAQNYISGVNSAAMTDNKAYGFDIIFCMRTKLVDEIEASAKGADAISLLSKPVRGAKSHVTKQLPAPKPKKKFKFKGEVRGTFKDFYAFGKKVMQRG